MGAKDSKRSACLSYEDAVKRISDVEYKRACEAFKRLAGPNAQLLNKAAFVQNVLGDGVPTIIAEWLYGACGGSAKGISQRDLICGLVLLTRGTEDEKVRFLWTLYSSDGYTGWIQRVELEKALRWEEAEPLVVQHTIRVLFGAEQQDRINYEQFRAYLSYNKQATVLSRWLLISLPSTISDGTTTLRSTTHPTFYQSLAGVTHLHERDIVDLEKAFWTVHAQSPTSQLDTAALMTLVSPPVPATMCQGLFAALDENQDGHVDFKELCCGISAACRGPKAERMKFCFKIFDVDRDNQLNLIELDHLLQILSFISSNNEKDVNNSITKLLHINIAETEEGQTNSEYVSLQDFLMWAIQHERTIDPLLQLLFEVGHVNLGLRPQCRHLERDIILGWRDREMERGYRVGQYWYLISTEWWQHWLNYTNGNQIVGNIACHECGFKQQTEESNYGGSSASSNQSTSTDSMGDLLLLRNGNGTNNTVDTSSLGSSSGVSSSSNQHIPPSKVDVVVSNAAPGPIDNSNLLNPTAGIMIPAVPTLTGEGGRLRTDITLCEGRDFILVPDSLWKAIAVWYGGNLPLPRQVILPPGAVAPEMELYPLNLKILRHQQLPNNPIIGEAKVPGRYLAHTAAFSRLATVTQVAEFLAGPLQRRPDEIRLWLVKGPSINDNTGQLVAMDADDDVEVTLHELGVKDGDQLLLEVRNADLTWPEELGALASNVNSVSKQDNGSVINSRRATIGGNLPAGATGLHNLGNTCFMNAALQTLSNTPPLTQYFLRNIHLSELNTLNPMGSRGQVARRYAELVHQLWAAASAPSSGIGSQQQSSSLRSVAPLKLRWCVNRHAPDTLGGGGQHDSQELLAWLLDQLHEDLNRVRGEKKVYRELEDSGGRPDEEVAAEAWRLHCARDSSIITDLFYGQLKSKVTCESCKHESVRFDAFNLLSLPLPMENYTLCEVLVLPQSFPEQTKRVPLKYGIRLPLKHGNGATVRHLKRHLQRLCGIPASNLIVTVLANAQIQQILQDDEQLPQSLGSTANKVSNNIDLVTFELPEGIVRLENKGKGIRTSDKGDNINDSSSEAEPEDDFTDECKYAPREERKDKDNGEAKAVTSAPSSILQHRQELLVRSPETTVTVGGGGNQHQQQRSSLLLPPQSASSSLNSTTIKQPFTDQPNNSTSESILHCNKLPSYLIAVHRKTLRQETYFLHQQQSKPSLFGIPMLLACDQVTTTGQDLYKDVWRQVARLLSPAPPETNASNKLILNHATDCDDSLGYEFPFTLRAVLPGGQICALCHWTNFCRGCIIQCSPDIKLADVCLKTSTKIVVAIDWDPTALHLRYQSGREKEYAQHESLFEARRLHTEPIDLDHCLKAFTQEERLEAKYHCSGCKSKQAATKKLQIWRLPPILIVHLKRFDRATCSDGDVSKWVKTHKVVDFPFDNFDPTAYLAAVPQETIVRHQQLQGNHHHQDNRVNPDRADVVDKQKLGVRERLESTSLQRTPIQDEHLCDYHQHHLGSGHDAFDLAYQLYAVVLHSGQMTGGHYISYAHNTNGHWYCYNDSSCREVARDHLRSSIDPSAAYLLFYERKGLDYRQYLPNIEEQGKVSLAQEDYTTDSAPFHGDNSSCSSSNVVDIVAQEVTEDCSATVSVTSTAADGGDSSDLRRQICCLQ